MHHKEFASPTELKDAIKCFWYNIKDHGAQPANFEVQPDGYAEIIFYFGTLFSNAFEGGERPMPSPFIMGLLNQPAVFQAEGRLQIIAVRCYPWAVFDLLGLPSGKEELHIIKHPIAQFQPILNDHVDAGNIAEAISTVSQFFLSSMPQAIIDDTLHKAGAAMNQANGTIPVSNVAAAAHSTVRTLERKFKRSSGHSVKDVSALMRFEQARNKLWTQPDISLARLALELGYADQSHLSREFKRYSGTTPAAFARRTRQQAASNNFVAFVQA